MGSKGGEWARAFTDHYATVTNYNDAAVMRLLVERPTVFATEIPRSIEDGRGSGGTAREGERGEESQRRPVERVLPRKPVFAARPKPLLFTSPRAISNPFAASESRVSRLSLTLLCPNATLDRRAIDHKLSLFASSSSFPRSDDPLSLSLSPPKLFLRVSKRRRDDLVRLSGRQSVKRAIIYYRLIRSLLSFAPDGSGIN